MSILGIISQAKLLIIQQNPSYKTDPKLKMELNEILNFMSATGQIFRCCGAVGLCYYSLIAASLIVYCLPNLVPALRVFDYLNKNRSISLLVEPEMERKRISSKIDRILQSVIESNINLTKMVKYKLNGESLHHRHNDKASNPMYQSENKSEQLTPGYDEYHLKLLNQRDDQRNSLQHKGSLSLSREYSRSDLSRSNSSKSLIAIENTNNKFIPIATNLFLTNLRDQLTYLIQLKSQEHKIWPINGPFNTEWANEIRKLGLLYVLGYSISTWLFAQSVSYFGVDSSLRLIESSEFGSNFRNITFMDRLASANMCFICFFCAVMSSGPTLVLFINILNMMRHFNLIQSKISRLSHKLLCLRRESSELNHFEHFRNQQFEFIKRDLYFECDKSGIELYICYRIFRDETKTCMKVAECAVSQVALFLILTIIPTLPFFSYVVTGNAAIMATIMFALFFVADLSLLVCGAIHAYCVKYSRRMWYFIAYAEKYNVDSLALWQLNQPKGRQKNLNDLKTCYRLNETIDSGDILYFNPDYDYHSHNFITYHTMYLWRQLAIHEELAQEHFVCKLFGSFEVNYRSIIKYNYWIVSTALIIMSGTLRGNLVR